MKRYIALFVVLFMIFMGIGAASAFDFQTGPFGSKYTGVAFTVSTSQPSRRTSGLPAIRSEPCHI